MNKYRNEVRSQHTHSVAEYCVAMPRTQSRLSQLACCLVVDALKALKRVFGRGEIEELRGRLRRWRSDSVVSSANRVAVAAGFRSD